jgi:hypothetical protein
MLLAMLRKSLAGWLKRLKKELFWLLVGCFGACASRGLFCLQKVGGGPGGWGKEGLLWDFLFLFGEVYGYVDVVLGFLFLAGLFFAGPEEGPADRPEDEDDGQEEKDE